LTITLLKQIKQKMKITVAHSPDSDDAFMFYAMAKNLVECGPYEFEHVLCDIQTLSDKAINAPEYDLSAISYHAFAYASNNYDLMLSGASMGDNYGPMLVSKNAESPEDLLQKVINGEVTVAVPGLMTSAYLSLKLYAPKAKVEAIPFDEILSKVEDSKYQVGLIIHEGQINYQKLGFQKLINLGEWWHELTGGLPLPLGTNVLKKSLPENVKQDLSRILKQSIEYSLANRKQALEYALTFGRGLDNAEADEFVGMYVNDLTVDLGSRGKEAVKLFFQKAYETKLIPNAPVLEYV
jgi:1,4-dihydroxy-6-naphthoate synthase